MYTIGPPKPFAAFRTQLHHGQRDDIPNYSFPRGSPASCTPPRQYTAATRPPTPSITGVLLEHPPPPQSSRALRLYGSALSATCTRHANSYKSTGSPPLASPSLRPSSYGNPHKFTSAFGACDASAHVATPTHSSSPLRPRAEVIDPLFAQYLNTFHISSRRSRPHGRGHGRMACARDSTKIVWLEGFFTSAPA